MLKALAIFGFLFGTFVVWLTVRIVNRKERWAKWTAWGLAVAILWYPLSAGPVSMICIKLDNPVLVTRTISIVYWPLVKIIERAPNWCFEGFRAYVEWWV
ncbi:MAG: hypothetical protein HY290_28195 [Planctomycetia bacterium]|nr:hypothetical protein [Planctomycetia bacterium]